MAIIFQLVDRGPHWLRYLATQDGVVNSPPAAADGFNTIPNDAGATPDLRTDALTGMAEAPEGSIGGSGMLQIMRARLDGYGPLPAAALTQAQARALLAGRSLGVPGNALGALLIGRCYLHAQPRLGQAAWRLDANVDAQGDAVVEVRSQVGVAATAYIDIVFKGSFDL
jgi:hypothetical protein